MMVDMAMRGELRNEAAADGSKVDVVGKFAEGAEGHVAAKDITVPGDGSEVQMRSGLEVLLNQNAIVRNSGAHRELMKELSHHRWLERGHG